MNKKYKKFFECNSEEPEEYMEPEVGEESPHEVHRQFMSKRYPGYYKKGQVPSDMFGRGGESGIEESLQEDIAEDDGSGFPSKLSDEARELVLFVDNDGDLYRQRYMPMLKNIAGKIRRGTYNPELAPKLWKYLADEGAKKYEREYMSSGDARHVFSPSVRKEVADLYAKTSYETLMNGEYPDIYSPNPEKTVQGNSDQDQDVRVKPPLGESKTAYKRFFVEDIPIDLVPTATGVVINVEVNGEWKKAGAKNKDMTITQMVSEFQKQESNLGKFFNGVKVDPKIANTKLGDVAKNNVVELSIRSETIYLVNKPSGQ